MCSHSLFGALLNTSPPIITNLEYGVSWRRSNEQGHSQIQFFSHVRPVHEGRSLNLKPVKYSEMLWSERNVHRSLWNSTRSDRRRRTSEWRSDVHATHRGMEFSLQVIYHYGGRKNPSAQESFIPLIEAQDCRMRT